MFTDDDAAILDTYDLIQTVKALNPARAARQRELLRLVSDLGARELVEHARFLLKLASIVATKDAARAHAPSAPRPTRTHRRRGRPRKEREKPELLPEVTALRLYRLDKDLPYRVLGEEVSRAIGKPVRMETLRNVITGAHAPHPQTLVMIEQFLHSVEMPPAAASTDGDEATH